MKTIWNLLLNQVMEELVLHSRRWLKKFKWTPGQEQGVQEAVPTARFSTLYYVCNFFVSQENHFKIKISRKVFVLPGTFVPVPQVWCLTLEISINSR